MAGSSEYRMGENIAGRYLIEAKIGESPAGYTYLANENHSSQKLCLKIYRPEISLRLLEEGDFFLKAAVQTTLQNEGLAQVFEITEHEGQVIVAREFVEGESFEEFAQKSDTQGGKLTQGMERLWQVAQTLSYLHENQRHLRIHPRNLIIGPLGAKLVDGDPRALPLSDLIPESLPTRPEYRGYRAPETRSTGFVAYPNSDLFSLAGLMYRLVVGAQPNEDLRANHQALQGIRVDRVIEDFLVKAMHPHSEDRFGTAEAFSEALWTLQPYLERLQATPPKRVPVSHTAAPTFQAPPAFSPPYEPPPIRKSSATEFGFPPAAKSGSDIFSSAANASGTDLFSTPKSPFVAPPPPPPFQPSPHPFGSSLEAPMREPTLFGSIPKADPFASASPASGSETFFGSIPPDAPKVRTDFFAKPTVPAKPPTEFSFKPPTAAASPFPPAPAARPAYQPPQPPPQPPPARMSSLETDSADLTLSGSETGMTQFGFKGADGNRTGDFGQELVRRKRRMALILGIVATLGVVILLVVLYFVLRAAAPQPKVATQDLLPDAGLIASEPSTPTTPSPPPPQNAADQPPFPESPSGAAPDYEDAVKDIPAAAPPPPAAETPKPKPSQALPPVQAPSLSTPTASAPSVLGNSKVSAARATEIDAAFKAAQWPATARDRLKMADDFNDLGRLADANLVYQKVLLLTDLSPKERTSALGGMAVTYKNMNLKREALAAVEKLLEMNPKNRFALGLKAELQ